MNWDSFLPLQVGYFLGVIEAFISKYAPQLPIIISTIALAVSFLSFIVSRNSAKKKIKSEITRDIGNYAMDINQTFAGDITSPYSHLLKIPENRRHEFNLKAVTLLKQMTLMSVVYKSQEHLGDKDVKAHQKWARLILRPWIYADEDLMKIWALAIIMEDMMTKKEKDWLNDLIPIPAEIVAEVQAILNQPPSQEEAGAKSWWRFWK